VCSPGRGVCPMLTCMMQAGSYKLYSTASLPKPINLCFCQASVARTRYTLLDRRRRAPGMRGRRGAQHPFELACALPGTIAGRRPRVDAFPDDVGEKKLRRPIHEAVDRGHPAQKSHGRSAQIHDRDNHVIEPRIRGDRHEMNGQHHHGEAVTVLQHERWIHRPPEPGGAAGDEKTRYIVPMSL